MPSDAPRPPRTSAPPYRTPAPSPPRTSAPPPAPIFFWLAAAILFAAFLSIYLPDVGHGFIKDDFRWIESSRADDVGPAALFSRNVGFYRPLVSLTFAADYAAWGLAPFGYGITNLALSILDAILLIVLVRRLELPVESAVVAAAVWALNFHGVNMAILWLSGRTALLVVLFSLATAAAFLRSHYRTAGLLCLAAMLCKEEAVMLPALLTLFLVIDRGVMGAPPAGAIARHTWPLWGALAIYAALRLQSGAFGPIDAPSYYRFSFAPVQVLRNVVEYADRAGTLAALVALTLTAATWRTRAAFNDNERRALSFAMLWIPATYMLTIFLPSRSSLYALLPSIGSSLAVAALASRARRTSPTGFQRVAIALVVIAVAVAPIHRARNHRWVALAERSSDVITAVRAAITQPANGGRVVLVDDPMDRFNLDAAFGSLLPSALALTLGAQWSGEIVSPGTSLPANTSVAFRLWEGRLEPIASY